MLYLEDYLELIEQIPVDLRDRFTEMREMDLQVQNAMDELDTKVKLFFANCKKNKPEWKEQQYKQITEEYGKIMEDADEKVTIATQIYDLVDKHLRKLDQELAKFKMELEADNAGITEILEQRSLALDEPQQPMTPPMSNHFNSQLPYLPGQKVRQDKFSDIESLLEIPNGNVSSNLSISQPDYPSYSPIGSYPSVTTPKSSTPSPATPVTQYTIDITGRGGAAAVAAVPGQASSQHQQQQQHHQQQQQQQLQMQQQLQQNRQRPNLKLQYLSAESYLESTAASVPSLTFSNYNSTSSSFSSSYNSSAMGVVSSGLYGSSGGLSVSEPMQTSQTQVASSSGSAASKNSRKKTSKTPVTPVVPPSPVPAPVVPAESPVAVPAEPAQEAPEWVYDPNEPRYCLCNQVSYGEMVGCDNPSCSIEWFHYNCVGLTDAPKGKWYCPQCSQIMKQRRGGRAAKSHS